MRVPEAEQTVKPTVPNVPEPRPTPVISEAYGGQVFEARAKTGESILKMGDVLAAHVEKQLYWNSQEAAYDAVQRYKSKQQDIMYGEGSVSLKDPTTNNDIVIPKGLMARKMQQATMNGGVTPEYDTQTNTAKAEILGSLKNNPFAQKIALRQIDSYRESGRNVVISHQAQQDALGKIATFSSASDSAIRDMADARTDEERTKLIKGPGGIVESIQAMGDAAGWPKDKIDEKIDEQIAKAADVAVTSNIKLGGNEASALAILNNIPGVSTKDYANLQAKITTMAGAAERNRERMAKIDIEQNDKAMVNRVVSGDPAALPSPEELKKAYTLGLANLPGGISEKVYNALKDGGKLSKATPEEKTDILNNLSDAAENILANDGKSLDPNAKFEDVATYRAALVNAHNRGALSDATFLRRSLLIEKIFDKGLSGEVNQAYKTALPIWNYLKQAAAYLTFPTGQLFGLKPSDVSTDNNPQLKEAKAYLSDALMDELAKGPIPASDIHTVAQSILSGYIAKQHPEVLGAKTVPNNVASKTGITPLHNMQVPTEADRTLNIAKGPKQLPITQENLEYTAKKNNMTVEEVKKKLGIADGS